MPAERITVTVTPELAAGVRRLAAQTGASVSSIVEEALLQMLRQDALVRAIAAYEAEHGRFTDEEIRQAEAEMGYLQPDTDR